MALEQRNHNPRVGGSSPSSATISLNVINILQRLKNDFEAIFLLHTSYTLFGWLLVGKNYRFMQELLGLPSKTIDDIIVGSALEWKALNTELFLRSVSQDS